MNWPAFVLNLPWSLLCFVAGLSALPTRMTITRKPFALVLYCHRLWWNSHARASATGNVVLVTPKTRHGDLEHELVHVEQYTREPFIHPFLYMYQNWQYGYRHNKYEVEAYTRAGNDYDA